MNWMAIIPVRFGGPRKTRLAGCLTETEREALANRLFAHVAEIVRTHPAIAETLVLSPLTPPSLPGRWEPDEGRGLNVELEALRDRLGPCNLLVVHADLPRLTHADLSQLILAAEEVGIAIAPDHRDEGTNALALGRGSRLRFAFGPGSLAAHRTSAAAGGIADPPLVVCPGLAHDVDCPEDLALAAQCSSPPDRRRADPTFRTAATGRFGR